MIKELIWEVVIKGTTYAITFAVNVKEHTENKVSRMYGLDLSGIAYVLTVLTDGTYRLYSKAQRKLYIKGRSGALRFLPHIIRNDETVH